MRALTIGELGRRIRGVLQHDDDYVRAVCLAEKLEAYAIHNHDDVELLDEIKLAEAGRPRYQSHPPERAFIRQPERRGPCRAAGRRDAPRHPPDSGARVAANGSPPTRIADIIWELGITPRRSTVTSPTKRDLFAATESLDDPPHGRHRAAVAEGTTWLCTCSGGWSAIYGAARAQPLSACICRARPRTTIPRDHRQGRGSMSMFSAASGRSWRTAAFPSTTPPSFPQTSS